MDAFARSPAKTGENDIGLPIISQLVADEFTTASPLTKAAGVRFGSFVTLGRSRQKPAGDRNAPEPDPKSAPCPDGN